MSLNAYLSVKGAKQGQIKGSVTQKGREGQIAVYEFHHEVMSPRDASSGMATGKRVHKPLMVTKEIDKSTPLLLTALTTNEILSEVILRFYAPAANGVEAQVYTIKLTNANIASIADDMSLNKVEPGLKLPVLETITFIYQKIEWTWVDGNVMASDNWSS